MMTRIALAGLVVAGSFWAAGCREPEPKVLFRFEGSKHKEEALALARQERAEVPAGRGLDAYTYKVPRRRLLYYYSPILYHDYAASYDNPFYGPGEVAGYSAYQYSWPSPYFEVPSREQRLPEQDRLVRFEVQASPASVPPEGGAVSVRARLRAPSLPAGKGGGLNLGVVLDASASMGDPGKLALLKEAALYLADQAVPGDRVAIVAFDDEPRLLLSSEEPADVAHLRRSIEKLAPRGGAGIGKGLLEAYKQVEAALEDGSPDGRVILITDGLLERGGPDAWRLEDIARREHAAQGIRLSVVGVGSRVDARVLAGLARAGEGRVGLIDQEEDVAAVLAGEMRAVARTFARNARLRVETDGGVAVAGFHGAGLPAPIEGKDEVALADLSAGEERSILVRLRVPPGRAGQRWLTRFTLQYDQGTPARRSRLEGSVSTAVSSAEPAVDASVEAYSRLVLGVDLVRRAVEARSEAAARSAVEFLRGDFRELKARAAAGGDRELILEAQRFEHFASRLERLADRGRLEGASAEREELLRDLLAR